MNMTAKCFILTVPPNHLTANPFQEQNPIVQTYNQLQACNKASTKNSENLDLSHLAILLWHRSRAQTTQHGSVEMSDHWEASEFEHARATDVAMTSPAMHKNGSFTSFIPGGNTMLERQPWKQCVFFFADTFAMKSYIFQLKPRPGSRSTWAWEEKVNKIHSQFEGWSRIQAKLQERSVSAISFCLPLSLWIWVMVTWSWELILMPKG